MNIEMNGVYETVSGRKVKSVLTTTRNHTFPVVVEFVDGGLGCYSKEGHASHSNMNININILEDRLIEVNKYAHLKIDDPVLIQCHRRHFAGVDLSDTVLSQHHKMHFAGVNISGKAMVFPYGRTSWTAKSFGDNPIEVEFCEVGLEKDHD